MSGAECQAHPVYAPCRRRRPASDVRPPTRGHLLVRVRPGSTMVNWRATRFIALRRNLASAVNARKILGGHAVFERHLDEGVLQAALLTAPSRAPAAPLLLGCRSLGQHSAALPGVDHDFGSLPAWLGARDCPALTR